MTSTRTRLAPLIGSVYLPSLIYAAGASALVPAQVLLALSLGFTAAGVAGIINGTIGVIGTAWMAWWTPRLVPHRRSAR